MKTLILFLLGFILCKTVFCHENDTESLCPKDSCERSRNSRISVPLNWKDRNCFCDNLCKYYGDCCLNAKTYDETDQRRQQKKFDCINLRNYGSIYMRRDCPLSWNGSEEVKKMCEAATPEADSPRGDPFLSTPITSTITKVTYANYYCAVCNEDTVRIEPWSTRVECPSLDALVYNSSSESNATRLKTSELMETLKLVNNSWIVNDDKNVTHKCFIDPFMPTTAEDIIRLCIDSVDSCPPDYTDESVSKQCNSYTAIRYDLETVYRNYHCGLCNNADPENMACYTLRGFRRHRFRNEFDGSVFNLPVLFDFSHSSTGGNVGFRCNEDQIFDPFSKKCRQLFCFGNFKSVDGECVENDESSVEIILRSTTIKPSSETEEEIDLNKKHEPRRIIVFPGEIVEEMTTMPNVDVLEDKSSFAFLNCNRILLPHGEFELQEDSFIVIPKYEKTFGPDQYEHHESGVLVCTEESETAKFSPAMGIVSLCGMIISILCLLFHLIAFVFVPDLRNLSGKNLSCLCVSLLIAYSSFLFAMVADAGTTECFVLACLVYYYFLSAFCWMNVMAFDVWRTLRLATTELRVANGKQHVKFLLYSIYSWTVPAIALALVLLIEFLEPDFMPKEFMPELGQHMCWFGQRSALVIFFAVPLIIIMVFNIFCFVMAARMVASAAHTAGKLSSNQTNYNFVMYSRLALLMGLSWIIGILAGYFQEVILWYIFIIINTLQGFFIFISFTCKQKVFEVMFPCSYKSTSHEEISSDKQNLESRDSNHSQISSDSHTSRCSEREHIHL